MSNLPATFSTGNLAKLRTAQRVIAKGSAAGSPYLRLIKSGEWVFGADSEEVQDGSLWAVSPTSLEYGFCAWDDGECLGEVMASYTEAPINERDLENVGAPWREQSGVKMVCVKGAHKGTTVHYKASSQGGREALALLFDDIVSRAESGEEKVVPVVELEMSDYRHKKYGKIYKPVLAIRGWESMTATEVTAPDETEEDDDEPVKVITKKASSKKKPVVVEADVEDEDDDFEDEEVEQPAPARTRRRRA